jgi:hypothetical protein
VCRTDERKVAKMAFAGELDDLLDTVMANWRLRT